MSHHETPWDIVSHNETQCGILTFTCQYLMITMHVPVWQTVCIVSLLNGWNWFNISSFMWWLLFSLFCRTRLRFKLYTQDAISEMKSCRVSRLNYAYNNMAEDDNSDTRKVLICLHGNLVEKYDWFGNWDLFVLQNENSNHHMSEIASCVYLNFSGVYYHLVLFICIVSDQHLF